MSNVTLDNQLLTNWTTCLTDNFVPNFQNNATKFINDIKNEQLDSPFANSGL